MACPPSPLLIIHNDIDADDDDENDEDDDEPSVPLEQYRAWLGESGNVSFPDLCAGGVSLFTFLFLD